MAARKKQKMTPPVEVDLEAEVQAPQPKGHYAWYLTAFLIALVIFGATAFVAHEGQAMGWEYAWFSFVNNWPEWLRRPMIVITFFGSTLSVLVITVLAFVLRFYRFAWRYAFTSLGAYAVVALAKHFIDRARPEGLSTDIHLRIAETGMGFPSGHATAITVLTLTLLPYVPRKWRWLLPLPIIAVCLSRLYLGVHVPLDVIGGVALGTAAVAFVRLLPYKIWVALRLN